MSRKPKRRPSFLTLREFRYLNKKYGEKFTKALKAVNEGRVKRYRFENGLTIDFVVGDDAEYLVIPEARFCSCKAFRYGGPGERRICYHLLAVELAERFGLVEEIQAEFEHFDMIIKEIRPKD